MTTLSPDDHPALRVVVADDDAFTISLVGDGLRAKGFDVSTATTASEAWKLVMANDPHCLVSDLNFGAGTSGATLLRRASSEHPWMGLVVLTSHLSPELAVEDSSSLPPNVVYLVKSQLKRIDDLADAVRRAISGRTDSDAPVIPVGTFLITAAQAEVLRMLAAGASTKALAAHRGTTVRAAETMLSRLYAALELGTDPSANSSVSAVRLWQQGRIIVRQVPTGSSAP